MLIGIVITVGAGIALYSFLRWGLSGSPSDQLPGFDPILGTTTRNYVEDDRGIVGPAAEDIEAVNRDR